MAVTRPAAALVPRLFGRRAPVRAEAAAMPASALADDLRLFAVTFAAGFLFVAILIG
jgi:hypothetical protein